MLRNTFGPRDIEIEEPINPSGHAPIRLSHARREEFLTDAVRAAAKPWKPGEREGLRRYFSDISEEYATAASAVREITLDGWCVLHDGTRIPLSAFAD